MKTAIKAMWEAKEAIRTAKEVLNLIYDEYKYNIVLTGTTVLYLSNLADDYHDIDLIVSVDDISTVASKFKTLSWWSKDVKQCNEYHENSWYIKRNGLEINICLTNELPDLEETITVGDIAMTTASHILKWKMEHKRPKDIEFMNNLKHRFSVVDSIDFLGSDLTKEIIRFH